MRSPLGTETTVRTTSLTIPVMTFLISPGSLSKSNRSQANTSSNTRRCLEADAVLFEVGLALSGISHSNWFIDNIRPTR